MCLELVLCHHSGAQSKLKKHFLYERDERGKLKEKKI